VSTYAFVIPLPTAMVTPNSRLHWAARARQVAQSRQTTRTIASQFRTLQGVAAARSGEQRGVTLTLVRGKHQRILDEDNCVGALKPILDGLKDAGWIYDDRRSSLWPYTVSQLKDNAVGPCVMVEVAIP
jgi:hypothetical protein